MQTATCNRTLSRWSAE